MRVASWPHNLSYEDVYDNAPNVTSESNADVSEKMVTLHDNEHSTQF